VIASSKDSCGRRNFGISPGHSRSSIFSVPERVDDLSNVLVALSEPSFDCSSIVYSGAWDDVAMIYMC
jgi:hypothetical protein